MGKGLKAMVQGLAKVVEKAVVQAKVLVVRKVGRKEIVN